MASGGGGMSNRHRHYGEIDRDEAERLEAAGDVSYRVRVVYTGKNGTVGRAGYSTTLRGAESAADRLVAKWGKYAAYRWDQRAPESCDVLIEARERRYNDDGTVMVGMYSKPWRLLERRTVSLVEAVTA